MSGVRIASPAFFVRSAVTRSSGDPPRDGCAAWDGIWRGVAPLNASETPVPDEKAPSHIIVGASELSHRIRPGHRHASRQRHEETPRLWPGDLDTPASRERHHKVIAEWEADARRFSEPGALSAPPDRFTRLDERRPAPAPSLTQSSPLSRILSEILSEDGLVRSGSEERDQDSQVRRIHDTIAIDVSDGVS